MLFDAHDPSPRLFATTIGTDFCAALIDGVNTRLAHQPPEARAKIDILVANERMRRRLKSLFAAAGPGFMPRIRTVLSLGRENDTSDIAQAIPPLRLRLELAGLIGQVMDRFPDLAPRAAMYRLADSLADLMGEMFEEGVTPEKIATLNVADHARHWQRAQALLGVIAHYFGDQAPLTQEARHSLVIGQMIHAWQHTPPQHPIIVAGSTGSRHATARLMVAAAQLPQGAVIVPGLDRALPKAVWTRLLKDRDQGLIGEDHPQFRLAAFAEKLGLSPWDIVEWHPTSTPNARNRTLSLALRPAPVTNQWRVEGPKLTNLRTAFADVTLLEAPNPQTEATAIALRLRAAAEHGQRAALISADARLVRQVTAALDQWGIVPDDSAGRRLAHVPGGVFLRLVVDLTVKSPDAETMMAILKHPLCHSGAGRGPHLQRARDLELQVLRGEAAMLTPARLKTWATHRPDDPDAMEWITWMCDHLLARGTPTILPLMQRVDAHLTRAAHIAAGSAIVAQGSAGKLYEGEDGAALAHMVEELRNAATVDTAMSALEYRDIFAGLAHDREVRHTIRPHANILIWGTQEARVQGADVMIVSGLNEGTWPHAPDPDPWLNRAMRAEAGLRLPDRVIGLSAHDFQQSAGARQVWFTRAVRDDETDTVPSRWLNRLTNLLQGAGPEAAQTLADMRARGQQYLQWTAGLAQPVHHLSPAPRPAPCPPVQARPSVLGVTQIEKLIRDPYAIYAARILRLYPLDPLRPTPDAALRGTVLHAVMRLFVDRTKHGLPKPNDAIALLLECSDEVLTHAAPWPAAHRLWRARLEKVADHIVTTETARRAAGQPIMLETKGTWHIAQTDVWLKGTVDRIDQLHNGGYAIFDYKTGKPPTAEQERAFTKQLWLEALMALNGAFDLPSPVAVDHIAYLGLGTTPSTVSHTPTQTELAQIQASLQARLAHMRSPNTGFPSRRAMQGLRYSGDYDHLARFGEWDETTPPTLIPVGQSL